MKELINKLELDTEKPQIELVVKKKQEIEFQYLASLRPKSGHKVWEINVQTLEVNEAKFRVSDKPVPLEDLIKGNFDSTKKDIITKDGHVYIAALNGQNAVDRYKKEKGSATLGERKPFLR